MKLTNLQKAFRTVPRVAVIIFHFTPEKDQMCVTMVYIKVVAIRKMFPLMLFFVLSGTAFMIRGKLSVIL